MRRYSRLSSALLDSHDASAEAEAALVRRTFSVSSSRSSLRAGSLSLPPHLQPTDIEADEEARKPLLCELPTAFRFGGFEVPLAR